MADPILTALREIALSNCAHDPMHPSSPKWAALAKLIDPPPQEPTKSIVEVEFNEQPATEAEVLRRDIAESKGQIAELEQKLRQANRDLEAAARK